MIPELEALAAHLRLDKLIASRRTATEGGMSGSLEPQSFMVGRMSVEALEKLVEARTLATGNQWNIVHKHNGVHVDKIRTADDKTVADVRFRNGENDAAFICAAANFASQHAPALIERVKAMEEALRFYADPKTYRNSEGYWDSIVLLNDAGEIARKALNGEKA